MIKEWNRFKGWTVLERFLIFPDGRIHINKLAKELGIGMQTAHRFCTMYCKDGLFLKEEIGNVHQYRLNKDDARVRALLHFIGPYLVSDFIPAFLANNNGVLSISIYGSFASGEHGDGSDLDILIIKADEAKTDSSPMGQISMKLGRDANVTSISLARWRSMERRNDAFFMSVKKNHIVIWGNPL